MPILLQTMPKSVKSCQTVPKTRTFVYILFVPDRVLREKRQRKKCELQILDNFE